MSAALPTETRQELRCGVVRMLAPLTWETSGSSGTWAAFGATACAPSTYPSPSWRPETASLVASCPTYPSVSLRKREGGFSSLHRAKTQLMVLLMNIKNQAMCPLWHALVSAGVKKPEGQPDAGVPPQVSIFLLILGFTRSLCRLLNPWELLKNRLKFQNHLLFLGNLPKLSYLPFQPYLAIK